MRDAPLFEPLILAQGAKTLDEYQAINKDCYS